MGPPKPPLGDLILALAVAVVGVLGTVGAGAEAEDIRPVDVWALALVLSAALALAVRRLWPLVTLAVAAVALAVFLLADYPYGPVFLPFFVAVYTLARHRPPATAVPATTVALALELPHIFTHPNAIPGLLGVVPAAAWAVVPFSLGTTARVLREAEERERAEEVRRKVLDERLRIAQEVHDVVGHGLAAIKVQADVGLHVLAKRPEQAERALIAISRTSTDALEEVRATLSMVRDVGADTQERSPAAGLRRLDVLRERMSESGLTTDVEITGSPRTLPQAADLAGYRVVQESLTNALRHGEDGTATVRVHYDADAVVIVVTNPARVTSEDGGHGGHGIRGMRERVTALGGDLTAGVTAGGRFEVRASIPIREDE